MQRTAIILAELVGLPNSVPAGGKARLNFRGSRIGRTEPIFG